MAARLSASRLLLSGRGSSTSAGHAVAKATPALIASLADAPHAEAPRSAACCPTPAASASARRGAATTAAGAATRSKGNTKSGAPHASAGTSALRAGCSAVNSHASVARCISGKRRRACAAGSQL